MSFITIETFKDKIIFSKYNGTLSICMSALVFGCRYGLTRNQENDASN